MMIHVSKDTEDSINAAVRCGRFASADEMIARLVRDEAGRSKGTKGRRAQATGEVLTVAQLHQKLLAEGRISRLPETAADADDPGDRPVAIQGEPLSETVIRERR